MSTQAITLSHRRRLGLERAMLVMLLAAAGAVLLALVGVAFGSTWIPLEKIASIMIGGGERTERLIVLQFRLPRTVIAALSGGAMAVAGYLLQKVTRNSLASPGVLGVIDGAALGLVIFLALFSNESNTLIIPIAYQPVAALIGALVAIGMVFALSGSQASSAIRLLLFGIAVAAVCKAATTIIMLMGPIYRTTQAMRWLAGAVNEIAWGEIAIVSIALVPVMVFVFLIARKLPPTDLDEVSVRSLGLNLPLFRLGIFALGAALTAIAVAFVGAIGFVGLIAPHMARLLVGRPVIPAILVSFLLGAIMLMGADLVVRVLFAPLEVPAGTVTAVIGAPYFLYLVMRKERSFG